MVVFAASRSAARSSALDLNTRLAVSPETSSSTAAARDAASGLFLCTHFFVSAHVADATNTRPEYTRNKGLDDHYYKTLILQHIKKFKSVSLSEVKALLLAKLPDSLTPRQKQAKVKNLLSSLRMSGLDGQKIVATQQGKGGRWEILKP